MFALCLAHLLVDSYLTFVPTALPVLARVGRVTVGEGVLLASLFTGLALGAQPILGQAADRGGRTGWLLGAGVWSGCWLAVGGLPLPAPALGAAVVLAGLGVAAFHPAAASLVHGLASGPGALPPGAGPGRTGSARRGRHMAIFLAAGNAGWALPPLVLPRLLEVLGPAALSVAGLGGALASLALVPASLGAAGRWQAGLSSGGRQGPAAGEAGGGSQTGRRMATLMLVVVLRSAANFGFLALLPLHLAAAGWPAAPAGRLVALYGGAGVLGGLAGGYVAGWVGKRAITAWSLAVASLAMAVYLRGGAPAAPCLALAGGALLASFPITVVAAQEAMPGQEATAGGLFLGLAVGLGSLVVAGLGQAAERWGAGAALWILDGLSLAAALAAAGRGPWETGGNERTGEGMECDGQWDARGDGGCRRAGERPV